MGPASQGLLGRLQRANEQSDNRFGPHTAEVEAFIVAAAQLTPWQWRQVQTARQLVASVTKEGTAGTGSAKAIQAAIRATETRISEPMARAGEVLFDILRKKSEERQVAAWEAMTALIMRTNLPALKFAVHYAPFAALVPLTGADTIDVRTQRYLSLIQGLGKDQFLRLAQRWRLEPGASGALVQAVAGNKEALSEEAVAVAAVILVPGHLSGDEGWAAVRTLVHGGRVLGALPDLAPDEVGQLWAPIEPVISFARLDESAMITGSRPLRGRAAAPSLSKAPAPFGPNHNQVAAYIKGVSTLTPIQWLRVLDRRRLVASVAREGAAEPADVVRSIVIALDATRGLDTHTRCRAFAAVERAAYSAAPNGGRFAHKVATFDRSEWERIAASTPEANVEKLAPLVNAGTALIDFFGGRSDDEAVATWHAVAALVHRQQLPPIKFAASYAPFASAIPVTNPRSLGAMVSRYVTAVGRLGSSQCATLARPWQLSEELSTVLSRAVADGASRPGEEAAALAAVVAVPMRLATSGGWAAVKTAAFGGRVIAVRSRLTAEQLQALWEPLEPAIPLASLSAPARARR